MGRSLKRGLKLTLVLATLVWAGCEQVEARGLVKEGNKLYRAGKLAQALVKFEAARTLDPDFPLVHLHIGYAAMGLSRAGKKEDPQAKKAASAFHRYMQLKPGDQRGSMFYLKVLSDTGRFDEARTFLKKRLDRDPTDVKTVSNLGLFSSKAGRFKDALKWYSRRVELEPNNPTARYVVGALCFTHLRKNRGKIVGAERVTIADRGIAALKKAASLQRGYVKALIYINLLYRQRALAHEDPIKKKRDTKLADEYYARADALRLAKKKSKGKKAKEQR